jgi:hypothetical protein
MNELLLSRPKSKELSKLPTLDTTAQPYSEEIVDAAGLADIGGRKH